MRRGPGHWGRKRRFLREMLDHTAGFMGLLALDGTLLDVNRAALAVGGFAREDVIGLPFWETGWWNRSVAVQNALRAAIASAAQGQEVHDETIYFTAEGTERVVDRSLVPVRDETGAVGFIIAEGRDITDRKALERDLAASEARFRQMFRSSPASLLITRLRDGFVVDANDGFLSAQGLTREAIVGRTALQLGWWDSPADRSEFVRLVNRLGSARNLVMRARSSGRAGGRVLFSFERIDIDGEACVLATQLDVTERERVIVLDERQRISADLHDSTVQTLYAATLRLTEAERGLDAGAEALSHVQDAKRSLLEAIRATRAIVDGLAADELGEAGLRPGLWALADELERGAGVKTSVVAADDADTLLNPHTAGTLLIVAREATSNVARHSGATSVTMALASDGDEVELSVVDNGRGFEVPNWLDHGASLTGDGMCHGPGASHRGLHTMAQRAAQLGGRLSVQSAPGAGAAIRVLVPRALPSSG